MVNNDLFNSALNQPFYLIDGLNASTISKRHETFGSDIFQVVVGWLAVFFGSINVQKGELIHFLLIKYLHGIKRIAHVFMLVKFYGFHESFLTQQENRNYSWDSHVGSIQFD